MRNVCAPIIYKNKKKKKDKKNATGLILKSLIKMGTKMDKKRERM